MVWTWLGCIGMAVIGCVIGALCFYMCKVAFRSLQQHRAAAVGRLIIWAAVLAATIVFVHRCLPDYELGYLIGLVIALFFAVVSRR